jgi:uncharacterized protein YbjT (DUF2867 family)
VALKLREDTKMIANVIGATGLIGSFLVRQLIEDTRFSLVRVFSRRALPFSHPKLEVHIISFEKEATWRELLRGDVLFSTLGTTLKTAGSKAAQYRVDFEFQFRFALVGAQNGIPVYVLVSSVGANVKSLNFYSRMKGELDAAVQKLPFKHISIIRPGFLEGPRQEFRIMEKLGMPVMRLVCQLPFLGSWKPIHVAEVSKAMIEAALHNKARVKIYELGDVFKLASGKS